MNVYRQLMRKKLLEEIYDNLSPQDKRLFVQLTLQDKSYNEILQSLQRMEKQIQENKHSWLSDFGANVAGNAAFDGVVWLFGKLVKRL